MLKNPQILSFFANYLKNDVYSILGFYKYQQHIIYIAGLPKSGSTWLYNMMLEVPGYNKRFYNGPVILDEDGKHMNNWDDISDETFRHAPKRGYSVVKEHTRFSDESWEIITRHMGKMVVLYRDPRDVCVSLYHHHKNDEDHHLYKVFKSLDKDEGIDVAMKIVEEEYIAWIVGWKKAIVEHNGQILELRYEDLWTNPDQELKRVLDFYNLKVDEERLNRMLGTKISKEQDLKKSLKDSDKSLKFNTARKGGFGGWKNYFSEDQKEKFKSFAGDLLISLGYEKDYDW